jgi:hypothetical protein
MTKPTIILVQFIPENQRLSLFSKAEGAASATGGNKKMTGKTSSHYLLLQDCLSGILPYYLKMSWS